MPRGPSGLVVIKVDPQLKRDFEAKLDADGLTKKAWFVRRIEAYLAEQLTLPLATTSPNPEPQPQSHKRRSARRSR